MMMSNTNEESNKIKSSFSNVTKSLFSLYRSDEERDADNIYIYVLRGMVKGFLVYVAPLSILQRKITKKTIRRGVAISGFVGVIRALDRLLEWTNRDGGTFKQSNFGKILQERGLQLPLHGLSGAIAAYCAVSIDPTLLNSAFVFWCLVRGLRGLLPTIPGGATIVMCLSASQLLTAWVVSREHHTVRGYLNFLDRHGMKDSPHAQDMVVGTQEFCGIIHPGIGHFRHGLEFFISGFFLSLTVYIPLYLVFFIFGKRKSIPILIRNIAQSSIFLTLYCDLSYISGCIFYNTIWPYIKHWPIYGGKIGRASMFSHLWIAGLAVLAERPSRRPELAAYCATFALETFFRYCIAKGTITYRPGLLALGISFAGFLLVHYHDQQPSVAMKWLCGIK